MSLPYLVLLVYFLLNISIRRKELKISQTALATRAGLTRNCMYRIYGGLDGKIHLLMDYADYPNDVPDSWYTDHFETT